MSLAGPDLLCVSSSKESQEILRRIEREASFSYQTITLTEEQAANVLYINGTLVHRSLAEIPVSYQVFNDYYLLKIYTIFTNNFFAGSR